MSKLEKLVQGIAVSSLVISTLGVIATETAFSSSNIVQTKQAAPKPKPNIAVDEKNKFRFQLQSCYRQNIETVTCSILITNLAQEGRTIRLNTRYDLDSSRIFDYSGNIYYCNSIEVGNMRSDLSVETNMPPGIPVKALVSYAVKSNVKKLSAVQISYTVDGLFGEARILTYYDINLK